jgi:hypothetical protein
MIYLSKSPFTKPLEGIVLIEALQRLVGGVHSYSFGRSLHWSACQRPLHRCSSHEMESNTPE